METERQSKKWLIAIALLALLVGYLMGSLNSFSGKFFFHQTNPLNGEGEVQSEILIPQESLPGMIGPNNG